MWTRDSYWVHRENLRPWPMDADPEEDELEVVPKARLAEVEAELRKTAKDLLDATEKASRLAEVERERDEAIEQLANRDAEVEVLEGRVHHRERRERDG